MRRASLMVGFNNWGKTTLIYDLFSRRRFAYGEGYLLSPDIGHLFTVESLSNDDIRGERYTSKIERRMQAAASDAQDLVGVLCASREPKNDACSILNSRAFAPFDEIHLLLMRYKWDLHAELRISDIQTYFKRCGNKRLVIHVIDEGATLDDKQRASVRCAQAHAVISDKYRTPP